MKKVLVFSSHPLFGRGIERLLRQEDRFEILGFETAENEVISRVKEQQPDVVVVDSWPATCDPSMTVMRILDEGLGTTVIALSLRDDLLHIYREEQRQVMEVHDLIRAIELSPARLGS